MLRKPSSRRIPLGLYKNQRHLIDFSSETQLFLGLQERETHHLIRRAVGRSHWMIDVGSASGELAIYGARHLRKPCAVYAIDPNPQARAVCLQNFGLNLDTERLISVVDAFIGSSLDHLPLNSIPVDRTQHDFFKIDVDGGEAGILQSGKETLAAPFVQWLVETHSVALEQECIFILDRYGFQIRVIPNAWWRLFLPEQRPIPHNRWLFAERCERH